MKDSLARQHALELHRRIEILEAKLAALLIHLKLRSDARPSYHIVQELEDKEHC